MWHDPTIEVTCDGEHCHESIQVSPEYKYHSYSGKSGFYDCSDEGLESLITAEGWTIEDGKHFCEKCRERAE